MTTDHTELIANLKRLKSEAEADTLHTLPVAEVVEILAQATDILENSDIRPKVKPRSEQPEPAVGQVWRNRDSDRLVRIVEVSSRRIRYEALTGRGPKLGAGYPHYWPTRFDYVETPEEGSTDV